MRSRLFAFGLVLAVSLATPTQAGAPPAPPAPMPPDGSAPEMVTPAAPAFRPRGLAAKLKERPELPPERRAIVRAGDGKERVVDAAEAQAAGLTLVDLGDGWTPFIFLPGVAPDGTALTNRYRSLYLALADDQGDGDGQALKAGDHNYLELYGITPSLRVLRERFLADAADPCKEVDLAAIRAAASIPDYEPARRKKEEARLAALDHKIEAARKAAGVASLDELAAAQPALAKEVEEVAKARARKTAFPEIEKRLACEGLLHVGGKRSRHKAGVLDDAMREAVTRFQQKHKIYDAAALKKDTTAALARAPLDNDYDALVRTLTERVVSAADVLEDGSARGGGDDDKGAPTYAGAGGERLAVRNLVDEVTAAGLAQLGLDTKEGALAFFQRHPAEDFAWLRAAVEMPARPEYYAPMMDLQVVIDRGDVIYDPPFDEKGHPSPYGRHRFPSLTMYVKYRGQSIPLVHWRTTIGGWRSDQASNGYEYFRYKGSDVGPRVWRNIVAGPVWIAPESTPIRTLVKDKEVNGTRQMIVNYDEVGPGYLSAYGLVAAYNVVPGKDGKPDWDNGVRVHGSSEYRSIRNPEAYSHGCHRLMNHLAERLFSFVLRHRTGHTDGDKPLGFSRQFLWKEDVYELRLPTRGYQYVLEPPLPVNVLEGRIVGKAKKPITTYVPKPGVEYPPGPLPIPPDSPESKAGDGE